MAISTHSSSTDLDVGVGGSVAAAAEGDADAWSAIVDRYSPMIYGIARSFRLDAATAADVSQTVWLRLVENLGRLREPERVGAWLAATTRHECLRIFRLAQRQVLSGDEAVFDGDGDAEPVEAGILRAERDERCGMRSTVFPTAAGSCSVSWSPIRRRRTRRWPRRWGSRPAASGRRGAAASSASAAT